MDVAVRRRELLLRLLSGLLEALQRDLVLRDVDAGRVLELRDEPLDDALIPVVAAEAVVTGGRTDLNGGEVVFVLADFQQGDVEGTATEVEDEDELVFLAALEAVGKSGSSGFVDDARDVEAGDLTGVLGGLALAVVEVGRNGDHRVGDVLAQVGLGVALELHQRAGADLLRGVGLAVDVLGLPVGAHVALDRADGAVDVGDGLPLGDLTDEHLAVLVDCDDGRGRATAFRVCDDLRVAALEDGDDGVRGSEVDSNGTRHVHDSLLSGK